MAQALGTVIVGGSVAAVTAADELRRLGYDEPIVLVGDEAHAPYTRPPLSKGVLAGTDSAESITLPAFGDDVELRLGTRANGVDLDRRHIMLDDGDQVPFDSLLIATGARARTLLAEDRSREHVLRTLDDCLALRDELVGKTPSVLVIGAGFLGLEFASTCRSLGLDTTVVDIAPPLVRQLGPFLSEIIVAAAIDAGLRLRDSPGGVRPLEAGDGRISGVALDDGTRIEADLVVTAIGCRPNIEWLADSGLNLTGGVVVDHLCRAAPAVTAAGDVAAWANNSEQKVRRTPHYMHAVDHARSAASTIVHGDDASPYRSMPYFWTDLFDLTVKICGALPLIGEPGIIQGSLQDRDAILGWGEQGSPVAAATINHRLPLRKLRRLAGMWQS